MALLWNIKYYPWFLLLGFTLYLLGIRRSHWPRRLRRRSTTARLLRSWFRIPLGAWMFVCCECCVLSSRGLCDGLITRPGESYRLWRVVVCDKETSHATRLKPARGLQNTNPLWVVAPVEKKSLLGIHNKFLHL